MRVWNKFKDLKMENLVLCKNLNCFLKNDCYRFVEQAESKEATYSNFVYEKDLCFLQNTKNNKVIKAIDLA